MELKYGLQISDEVIAARFKWLANQIFKLLPAREEGLDWEKPLETIMQELAGMDRLFIDQHSIFFPLLCKLEGLFKLTERDDFQLYRRSIFECLSLLSNLQKLCQV